MFARNRSIPVRGFVAWSLLLALSVIASAQAPSRFRYVISKFTVTAGSELILSNLSSQPVLAQVSLRGASGALLSGNSVVVPVGSQTRLNSSSFTTGGDSLIIDSSGPLSAMGTLGDSGGENIDPTPESNHSILPILPNTLKGTELTLYNGDPIPLSVFILGLGSDGFLKGTVRRVVPGMGSITVQVGSLFPAGADDITHLDIRASSNALSPERHLYAQAKVGGGSDSGILNVPTPASAATNPVLPYFLNGGDFVTSLAVVNPSTAFVSGALIPLGTDGRILSTGTTFTLPPNGAMRGTADTLLNIGADIVVGSIVFASDAPLLVTEGIADRGHGTFLVKSPGERDTNFAFSYRAPLQSTETFALLNQSASDAHVKLRSILDDGTLAGQFSLTVGPFTSSTLAFSEIFPQITKEGFVYISSDVPVFVSAFEGRPKSALLANLPAMHSRPDYNPPNTALFRISGMVRLSGSPLSGVRVQLSGPTSFSVVTDQFGKYSFENLLAGQYNLAPTATGYVFFPSPKVVSVSTDDSFDNDFDASLVRPTITAIEPNAAVAGSPDTMIRVIGGPFNDNSQIIFEDVPLPTALTSTVPPSLQAAIPAGALTLPRVASLRVQTIGAGGSGLSDPMTFVIGSPAPSLISLSNMPDPLFAGSAGFSMTVTGSGFLPGVVIRIGGSARVTTLDNATTARITITTEELVQPASLQITALNPPPTVGPSNALILNVVTGAPTLTSILPTTADVRLSTDSGPLSITVSGASFLPGATVLVNNAGVPTEFGSSTSLTALVPASSLQVGGTYQVSVRNPEPSLGTSGTLPLTVNNLAPILTSIEAPPLKYDPSKPAPVTVTLHGEDFGPNSTFELIPPCAAFYAANRMNSQTAVLTMSLQCSGTYQARVRTPQPGGGTSQTLSFIVQ